MSGIDKYVRTMLHFDTDFTDESSIIWTGVGTPTVSTAQSKFGGKSLLLNGTSQYLATPSFTGFDFGTADFTIDWWEYRTDSGTKGVFANSSITSAGYPFYVGQSNGSNVIYYLSSNNSSWDIANGVTMGTIILNAWTHYALVRSGTSIKSYQNGVLKSTTASSSAIASSIGTATLGGLMVSTSSFTQGFAGYIDEFRISKGVARWAAAFTPPTLAYSYEKYFLAKLTAGNYQSIKSGAWVDLGIPADDTALIALMQASGTYYPPKQSSLEAIATGVNRPKRVCWQDTAGETRPTIQLTTVPQDKIAVPKNLISMYTFNDIVSASATTTISDHNKTAVLLHFDNDTAVLDSTKDIIPTGTTLITGTNSVVPVKDITGVKNKTFSITNKSILINDCTKTDTTGSFTLKISEYLTGAGTTGAAVLFINSNPVQWCGLLFGYKDANGNRYLDVSNSGTAWNEVSAIIPTTLNVWVRWEIDYDVTTKKLYLFREGILLNTWTLSVGIYYNPAGGSEFNAWSAPGTIQGMIADFDFIKGTCTHTTAYTPDAISSTVVNKTFIAGLTDANSKFGNAMYLDGSSYLSLPNYTLDTTKDFTISLNTLLTSCPSGSGMLSLNGSYAYDAGILFGYSDSTNFKLFVSSVASTTAWDMINSYNICTIASILNILVNWEIDYKDATKTLYIFKNGVLVNSWILPARIYYGNFGGSAIGFRGGSTPYQTGYFDEILVLEGQCLHTSNFTIPTAVYTDNYPLRAAIKMILSLDLINYKTFNFTTLAWETIDPTDLTAVKTNGISASLLSTITEAQWNSFIGTAAGVGIGFLLSENYSADQCLLDTLALTVNMKGNWSKAIHVTDYTYGYTNNNVLSVTLVTAGSFKINYNSGKSN